jgi:hypothetical protein
MKKLILSSLAVLGLSAAFVAPAEAQVLVNSTPPGGSITGAASFTNFNGSTSAIAGEVTYPEGIFAEDVNVVLQAIIGTDPTAGDVILSDLLVDPLVIDVTTLLPSNTSSVEAAVATLITNAADLNEQVSLIRAWTSGGLD